jgi:glycosyltransferase involved in cell wall biosynthesis
MRRPSISVITPSYNQGGFIEETLRSVLDQGYPELEYQVMDGGSSDGTVDILKRYDGRLRWVSQKDGGQGAALVAGFQRTSGEIIGWVNSDDLYAPGALAAVGEYFAAHPEVEWLFGRCPIIDRDGHVQRALITRYKELWLRRYSWRRLLIENYISQPAVFFRRRLYQRVGPIDPKYQCAMDYDLWLRMGAVARPAFLDRELARFRVYGETKMSTLFERSFQEEIEIAGKVAAGRHPVLMALHHLNRYKLLAAYKLMAATARR